MTGPGIPGIVVQAPDLEGVENIAFDAFTMGVTITGVNQVNETLNFNDSVSRVFGSHTVKLGGQFQFSQVELDPNATFNGTFTFAGTETGSDPSKGSAFNTACFSLPPLGEIGSAPRRFFYGPGIENFDMALIKDVSLTPTKSLQIRVEVFNMFNHPQFYGAGAVDGNITSSTFGQIVAAASPRLIQIATNSSSEAREPDG